VRAPNLRLLLTERQPQLKKFTYIHHVVRVEHDLPQNLQSILQVQNQIEDLDLTFTPQKDRRNRIGAVRGIDIGRVLVNLTPSIQRLERGLAWPLNSRGFPRMQWIEIFVSSA